jgi:hypothetical protein
MAKATLGARTVVDWDGFVANYDLIRDAIEDVFPIFQAYNARIRIPGGFYLTSMARERIWSTPSGKANFLVFQGVGEDQGSTDPDLLWLTTVRSHDQYNTTIYSMSDRSGTCSSSIHVKWTSAVCEPTIVSISSRIRLTVSSVSSTASGRSYAFPDGCCAAYCLNQTPCAALFVRSTASPSSKASRSPGPIAKS